MNKVVSKGLLKFDHNWAWISNCGLDTIKYYHWFLGKKGKSLNLPIWKAHITIIRSSDNFDCLQLHPHYLKEITFSYHPENIGTNGSYWWIEVECPAASLLRQEYGLSFEPEYPFHLTIGKEYS